MAIIFTLDIFKIIIETHTFFLLNAWARYLIFCVCSQNVSDLIAFKDLVQPHFTDEEN